MALAVALDAASTAKDDLWWGFSRAGIAIAFTTVAAAAATGAFRIVDQRRTRDEERRKIFHQAVQEYNRVKAVRRRLLALGLREARSKPFARDEWEELQKAIGELSLAQLAFEGIGSEVQNSELFNRKAEIIEALSNVEHNLNRTVLEKWEEHGWKSWRRADGDFPQELDLSQFTHTGHFKKNVSNNLHAVSTILQEELIGRKGARPS